MNVTIRQNTTNRGLSQYTGLFFDRGFARIGSKLYALNCSQLCLLGGDTDNGENISAHFIPGIIEFGDGRKRVRTIHLKGEFASTSAVTVAYAMDAAASGTEYSVASTSKLGNDDIGSLKFNGVRSSFGEYLSVKVANVKGASFRIAKIISFMVRGNRR